MEPFWPAFRHPRLLAGRDPAVEHQIKAENALRIGLEELQKVLAAMMEGVGKQHARKVLVIENRLEAIKTACALAKPGDIILVAGKGHENYQEIKGVRHHFDDREVVCEIFGNVNIEKP